MAEVFKLPSSSFEEVVIKDILSRDNGIIEV